ncbi:MAG TPA: DinB family protein [Gemmatimonadales bacterium]|nr:DinB family protein [Gemmatimonadales bacterium]
MSTLTLPRPAADEAAPFYHGYIAGVAGENVGEQLVSQLAEVERLFGGLDDQAALARYSPGKWSIKEILGHLTDAERIFAYRLLRVARGDATPLPGFDENAYVPAGSFDERPLRALTAEFRAVRLSTVALVSGVPPGSWTRLGKASGKPVSARALVYIMVGHVIHHLGVLRDRYGVGAVPAATSPTNS